MNGAFVARCSSTAYRVDVVVSLEKRVSGAWLTVVGSPNTETFYNVKPGQKLLASASAPCPSGGEYRMKAKIGIKQKKGVSLQYADPAWSDHLTYDPCGAELFQEY